MEVTSEKDFSLWNNHINFYITKWGPCVPETWADMPSKFQTADAGPPKVRRVVKKNHLFHSPCKSDGAKIAEYIYFFHKALTLQCTNVIFFWGHLHFLMENWPIVSLFLLDVFSISNFLFLFFLFFFENQLPLRLIGFCTVFDKIIVFLR